MIALKQETKEEKEILEAKLATIKKDLHANNKALDEKSCLLKAYQGMIAKCETKIDLSQMELQRKVDLEISLTQDIKELREELETSRKQTREQVV